MRPVTSFPLRLYLLELAHYEANGVPVQGYLIQTSDGMNILIDTGWPQEMIGAYTRLGSLGVHMDEEDFVVHQLATLGLTPRDIHLLICTHFDPDHSGACFYTRDGRQPFSIAHWSATSLPGGTGDLLTSIVPSSQQMTKPPGASRARYLRAFR